MALRNMEIQDGEGNVYYPHTDASIVKYGGSTVAKEITSISNDTYPIVEATGTNSYVGSTARITSLGKGTRCTLFVGTNSTGKCSLNLNGYGAKAIKDSFGNIVENLKSNVPYNLCYNNKDFILQGKGGGGDALGWQVMEGATYSSDEGSYLEGLMRNYGVETEQINCGETFYIMDGYHDSGYVEANSLASQTPANATASQILAGFSAWVNGAKINGSASIESLGGHRIEKGQFKYEDREEIAIINVGFRPKAVFLFKDYSCESIALKIESMKVDVRFHYNSANRDPWYEYDWVSTINFTPRGFEVLRPVAFYYYAIG